MPERGSSGNWGGALKEESKAFLEGDDGRLTDVHAEKSCGKIFKKVQDNLNIRQYRCANKIINLGAGKGWGYSR